MSIQAFETCCEALAVAKGTKDKQAILQPALAATRWLFQALDPAICYYVRLPEAEGPCMLSDQDLTQLLTDLASRQQPEIPPLGKWITRLLNKQLNIGVGAGTLNKLAPGLIPPFPIMLPDEAKLDLPWAELQHHLQGKWMCQPDPNGVRCIVQIANDKIYPKSADGVPIIHFKQLEEDLLRCFPDRNITLVGRLACVGKTNRTEHYAAFSEPQASAEDVAALRFYVQDTVGPEPFRCRQVAVLGGEHPSVEFLTALAIDYASDWQVREARQKGFKKLNLYWAEGLYQAGATSRDFLSLPL